MSYKDKTYVIFDGDKDIWAYRFMKGWKVNQNVDFDFRDAHDLKPLTDRAGEETVKRRLRERFSSVKQAIVLIGESTKHLYRFIRWEIEVAQRLDIPIVAVNLNKKRSMDPNYCPPILRGKDAVHVAFKLKIIKYALDNFAPDYRRGKFHDGTDWSYPNSLYQQLGITD